MDLNTLVSAYIIQDSSEIRKLKNSLSNVPISLAKWERSLEKLGLSLDNLTLKAELRNTAPANLVLSDYFSQEIISGIHARLKIPHPYVSINCEGCGKGSGDLESVLVARPKMGVWVFSMPKAYSAAVIYEPRAEGKKYARNLVDAKGVLNYVEFHVKQKLI